MGNKSSSPAGPPPLLSAAVSGDAANFALLWKPDSTTVHDRQDNNVLHALFSCRVPSGQPDEILRIIHNTCTPTQQLLALYTARNQLGCTPLWILIAYGNVALLEQVVKLVPEELKQKLPLLAVQPNHQGDTPLLATCSQGNLSMVQYLACPEGLLGTEIPTFLAQGNHKGTTPLQIVVANAHLDLLQYLLKTMTTTTNDDDQLYQVNAAGLSLFHICSERNFHTGLQALLDTVQDVEKVLDLRDKNGANALHVACFCGHVEVTQVWVDAVVSAAKAQTSTASDLLDRTDGQGRTAYWLAMVQGHEEKVAKLLSEAGVQTQQPDKMVQEIAQAQERRRQRRTAKTAVDGNALLRK